MTDLSGNVVLLTGGTRGIGRAMALEFARKLPTIPEDKLEIVADGRAIALLPGNDPRLADRDDIVTVPVSRLDPSPVVLCDEMIARVGPDAGGVATPGCRPSDLTGAVAAVISRRCGAVSGLVRPT